LPAAPATYHAELGENGVTTRQRSKATPSSGGCANCERLTVALNAAHRMLSKQAAAWCAQESALVTAQRDLEVAESICEMWQKRYPAQRVNYMRKHWTTGAVLPGSR
jgi:hypothetical protein